ncbi:MAG TPA: PTS sugar transporter subunit IIC [Gemmatimonadaceae bacterium]|nr:PTS sugar transporter subunit IIC [Gemmatimonadaceae bacterium]
MIVDVLVLGLLGALLGLDVVSFPQAQVSRPLVAATLGGALMGNAVVGLTCGVLLELFAHETLPFGASRYPEWGSSSPIAGAAAAAGAAAGNLSMALLFAVTFGLLSASVGGWSMVKLRQLNARLARRRLDALARGSARTVAGLQVAGASADLVRAGLISIIAATVALPTVRWISVQPAPMSVYAVPMLASLGGAVAAGAAWKMFHSTPGTRWFGIAGLAVGTGLAFAMSR